jgi:hypothetical protein
MTGTELLMAVADRFSKHGEARDILVIWTRSLGLAAFAKADLEYDLTHSEGGNADEEGNET